MTNVMKRDILKSTLPIALSFFLKPMLHAQESVDAEYYRRLDSIMQRRNAEQMAQQAVVLGDFKRLEDEMEFHFDWAHPMTKGLVLCFTQSSFREREATFREYHKSKEDYAVAAAPFAINWALKAAGVKSQSSTQRMITANAMALALHVGLTQGIKTAVDEPRPNGVDNKSNPSGHTSLAYMSAAILSREYGYLSPWVTVGSYGCATATQYLRMRHNNHWINDTFIGAGIGMLSVDLAYYLTDQMLGAKEINNLGNTRLDLLRMAKQNTMPSGLRYMAGTESGSKTIHMRDLQILNGYGGTAEVKTSAAYAVGVDASLFLNPYFSIEALARMSSAHAKVDATPSASKSEFFSGDSFTMYHFDLAANFGFPYNITKRLGYKALLGVRSTQSLTLDSYTTDAAGNLNSTPFIHVPGQTKFEVGAGMSYDALDHKNYAVGFNIEYYHTFSSIMPNRYTALATWKVFF